MKTFSNWFCSQNRVLWMPKALWIETINILRTLHKKKRRFGCPRPPKDYHRFMYIAPSSGEASPNLNLPFIGILRRFEVITDVWSENAAQIYSNLPVLYYGFKYANKTYISLSYFLHVDSCKKFIVHCHGRRIKKGIS